jgi:hypothetical protein
MEGSSHFNVPHVDTQATSFEPIIKLPAHLDQYAKISADERNQMTSVMQAALSLMDKMVLRTTALPQADFE